MRAQQRFHHWISVFCFICLFYHQELYKTKQNCVFVDFTYFRFISEGKGAFTCYVTSKTANITMNGRSLTQNLSYPAFYTFCQEVDVRDIPIKLVKDSFSERSPNKSFNSFIELKTSKLSQFNKISIFLENRKHRRTAEQDSSQRVPARHHPRQD